MQLEYWKSGTTLIELSDDELYAKCMKSGRCRLLTEVGYFEGRSESDEGVAAIMYVVLNRVSHPVQWSDTIFGVVAQKHQFSYRHDGSRAKGFTEKGQYRRIAIIARKVLDEEIESPVGEATFYHTDSIKQPSWVKHSKYVGKIGRHLFYSLG